MSDESFVPYQATIEITEEVYKWCAYHDRPGKMAQAGREVIRQIVDQRPKPKWIPWIPARGDDIECRVIDAGGPWHSVGMVYRVDDHDVHFVDQDGDSDWVSLNSCEFRLVEEGSQ